MKTPDERRPGKGGKVREGSAPKRDSIIPALALNALGILAIVAWLAVVALVGLIAWWAP